MDRGKEGVEERMWGEKVMHVCCQATRGVTLDQFGVAYLLHELPIEGELVQGRSFIWPDSRQHD
jgi:hypothetical protein